MLKEENIYLMIQKYFEGEIQKIVFGIRRRKRECARKVWKPTNFILDPKIALLSRTKEKTRSVPETELLILFEVYSEA